MGQGIPTYLEHTQFRSRLEAIWARFFTRLGWNWEYEPFDLDGYIPDFVVLGGYPFLVDVKPATTMTELKDRCLALHPKVKHRKEDLLCVGATLFGWDHTVLGIAHESTVDRWEEYLDEPALGDADLHLCGGCHKIAWHHENWYAGRPCRCYDGDSFLLSPESHNIDIQRLWREAKNDVQWKRPG